MGADTRYLQELRHLAWLAQDKRCYWCRTEIFEDVPQADPHRCTADHLLPLAMGGQTQPGNIKAACYPCNHYRQTWGWTPDPVRAPLPLATLGDVLREAGL
jgi:hypothetical protein